MGVGQSRELLGKVNADRVFICTNYTELFQLLLSLKEQQEGDENKGAQDISSTPQEDTSGDQNALEEQREETDDNFFLPLGDLPLSATSTEGVTENTCVTEESSGRIVKIHVANHYMGDDALHAGVLNALTADQTLESLNLSYNAFTARGISAISNALLRPSSGPHPRLRLLNLAGNHAGPEGCRAVAKLLEANPPIRELSLFHNGLYDRDVQPILNALLRNTKLRVLNFDLNYLTGNFLRMLLTLLSHNQTIAAVLFDGPYDPATLEPMAAARGATGEDATAEAAAAAARASLRRRLLCADFAGRPPFPKALVEEVEAILAPRRAAYIAERALEEAEGEGGEARDVKEEGEEGKGGEEEEGGKEEEQEEVDDQCNEEPRELAEDQGMKDSDGEVGLESRTPNDDDVFANSDGKLDFGDEEDEGDIDPYDMNDEEHQERPGEDEYGGGDMNSSFARRATRGTRFPSISGAVARASIFSIGNTTKGRETQSLRGLGSGQHSSALTPSSRAVDAAAKWRAQLSNKRKELTNGFDRMRISTIGSAIPGTRTACVATSESPRRLRACWCDPRDVAVPFSSTLHYHCKHEPTGGDLGDVGTDGRSLATKKTRNKRGKAPREAQQKQQQQQQVEQSAFLPNVEERKRTQYTGCKETSHKCESIGFYGKPRKDKSSVYFFSSEHPMHASSLVMDGVY